MGYLDDMVAGLGAAQRQASGLATEIERAAVAASTVEIAPLPLGPGFGPVLSPTIGVEGRGAGGGEGGVTGGVGGSEGSRSTGGSVSAGTGRRTRFGGDFGEGHVFTDEGSADANAGGRRGGGPSRPAAGAPGASGGDGGTNVGRETAPVVDLAEVNRLEHVGQILVDGIAAAVERIPKPAPVPSPAPPAPGDPQAAPLRELVTATRETNRLLGELVAAGRSDGVTARALGGL